VTAPDRPKPKGVRRIERLIMGLVMGVIAFILERVVMRSIRRDGGVEPAVEGGTRLTTKGAEIDVDEP
jgi:hypothetical protein